MCNVTRQVGKIVEVKIAKRNGECLWWVKKSIGQLEMLIETWKTVLEREERLEKMEQIIEELWDT